MQLKQKVRTAWRCTHAWQHGCTTRACSQQTCWWRGFHRSGTGGVWGRTMRRFAVTNVRGFWQRRRCWRWPCLRHVPQVEPQRLRREKRPDVLLRQHSDGFLSHVRIRQQQRVTEDARLVHPMQAWDGTVMSGCGSGCGYSTCRPPTLLLLLLLLLAVFWVLVVSSLLPAGCGCV